MSVWINALSGTLGWFAAGTLGACGLGLAIWALFWDQWRTRRARPRRCPKCWHNMTGVPSLRCPECGREAPSERRVSRPRRRIVPALVGLCLCATLPLLVLADYGYRRGWHYAFLPKYRITAEDRSHGFVIQWLETRDARVTDWERLIRIRKDGGVVFELHALYVSAEWWPRSTPSPSAKPTEDIVPTLVLTSDSGGTGCYADQYVFGVEYGALKPLAVLPFCGHFQDLDGDGVPEFIARDRTFAYWETSGGSSPYPEVIMQFDGYQYQPVLDLMSTPLPSEAELMQRIASFRNQDASWWTNFAAVLEVTLDLIYTGHEDRAWVFMRDHWPVGEGALDHDRFEMDLRERLTTSPFWPAIVALNRPEQLSDADPQ